MFFQTSVNVLGHIVSENGVSTDPEKTKAVQDWDRSRTHKQMRGFSGLCSYYRNYVKNFAQIARPLHKLCEKAPKFIWTEECEIAFKRLKEALTSPPILAYPVPGCKFILDTDASDCAVGGGLSHLQDNQEKLIAYMSKSLNYEEQIHCVTRKEPLAVV